MSAHGDRAVWAERAMPELCKKLNHNNYTLAIDDVMSSLVSAYPGEVVCFTGPSRVGKSRVIDEVINMMVPPEAFDRGVKPIVKVFGSNTNTAGTFSTKNFTIRALDAVGHPFYNLKEFGGDSNDLKQRSKFDRVSEGTFRLALEKALVAREVKYFVVDEAHHLKYVNGGDKAAAAILDSWKCLAESTGVVLVLVGAYPLIDVMSISPHMAGRAHQCHMPRYHLDDEDDFEEYVRILNYYSSVMAIDSPNDSLLDWGDYIYSKTFGCIGLLNIWLRDAVNFSSIRGEPALSIDSMQKKLKPAIYLKNIEIEIRHGEAMLGGDSEPLEQTLTAPATKRTGKPFQTAPKRYMGRS